MLLDPRLFSQCRGRGTGRDQEIVRESCYVAPFLGQLLIGLISKKQKCRFPPEVIP